MAKYKKEETASEMLPVETRLLDLEERYENLLNGHALLVKRMFNAEARLAKNDRIHDSMAGEHDELYGFWKKY